MDNTVLHHILQSSLAHDSVSEVQTTKLPHVSSPDIQSIDEPIVALTTRLLRMERRRKETYFKLQRTKRIINILNTIHKTVLEIISRIDAPLVSHMRMRKVFDTVGHRIPHTRIRTTHINLHSQGGLEGIKEERKVDIQHLLQTYPYACLQTT